jgi:hypothetical protein
MLVAMRVTWMIVAAAGGLVWIAGTRLVADDRKTSARPTAESGFAAMRKAAADKDEPTLLACLPSKLVAGWDADAKDDAKAWRADVAARIGGGTVVSVKEDHDSAIARWKTTSPDAVWEMRLRLDGGRWIAASPWAYCVGGAELAKCNGAKPAHVKLKARTTNEVYGPSAFSFVHVTLDAKQCLNRLDVVYCRCGQAHGRKVMFSTRKARSLDELDGIQTGGDWMDEIVPKNGAVYVLDCKEPGRKDFQVALQITALSKDAMEFDWRLVAAGKCAPASTRAPQPIAWSTKDADGTDGICGVPGK